MATSSRSRTGLLLAISSAATFGTSGSFARSLIDAGWTPSAAVAARVSAAALMLAGPTFWVLRGKWHVLRRNLGVVAVFGLLAVAGCQVLFFSAVQHLSVGVALMLEYLGTILVVGWMWLRHGHQPRPLTIAGSVTAVFGLALVLDLLGDAKIDLVGVLFGLAAAVGLAVYFVLSAHIDDELPPLALASTGMTIGAVALLGLGFTGALPMHTGAHTVEFMHREVSAVVPIVGLSLVAAAFAYVAGIAAARRLGAKISSFVGLTEVIFAVIFAWLFLGELPGAIQLVGGVLIVAGVTLVRLDELKNDEPDALEQAAAPTMPLLAETAGASSVR